MSAARNTMSRFLTIATIVLMLSFLLVNCRGSGGTNPSYSVTYDGNGNTSGVVPNDTTSYEQGQTVTVLGNTGNLVKTNYSFSGWNTQIDGDGTNYTQAQTFEMGAANVTLYAKWTLKWTGTKQLGAAEASTQANSVAVDVNGNVYVAGYINRGLDGNTLTGYEDFFVTMYDASGNKVRTKQLGAAGASAQAYGVAVDENGNVYVVGNTNGGLDGNTLTGYRDSFVTMYDSSGNMVRTKQLGAAGAFTYAFGVAVDVSGNVYVAGYTNGSLDGNTLTGNTDFFVIMYDPSGNIVRTKQLGVAGAFTYAYGVAVDVSGNVYVAGVTGSGLDGNTLAGYVDFFITTYDSAGNKVRTKQLGASNVNTQATAVATDVHGNVYVAGYTTGNSGLDGNTLMGISDFFVTMYDSSGNKVRTKQLGASGAYTLATGLATDVHSNVYVAGYTYGNGGLDGNTLMGISDFFVTMYDSSGNKVRTKQLGASGAYAHATGVVVDVHSNVYVAGYTYGNGGLDGNTLTGVADLFVTKYDSAGIKQ
jgi:uncharacterized repeat protein (TIGR02543 family)